MHIAPNAAVLAGSKPDGVGEVRDPHLIAGRVRKATDALAGGVSELGVELSTQPVSIDVGTQQEP